jgi:hypothetical protein
VTIGTSARQGGRAHTVYIRTPISGQPDLPALLQARREMAVAFGLDPADRALLDPATAQLLAATAARMRAERRRVAESERQPSAAARAA